MTTQSKLIARLVGAPTIATAPAIHIARSPSTGNVFVWVAGVGYLNKEEIAALREALGG